MDKERRSLTLERCWFILECFHDIRKNSSCYEGYPQWSSINCLHSRVVKASWPCELVRPVLVILWTLLNKTYVNPCIREVSSAIVCLKGVVMVYVLMAQGLTSVEA